MDRSVANLTTEQLYRKRAFDRVNQRASRARKKTRIAELEDEVAELKRQLSSSEEQVKRLQNSDAALRNIISAARSTLGNIDAKQSGGPSIPSPPASTHSSGSVQGELSAAEDDSNSTSTTAAEEERVLALRAGAFSSNAKPTSRISLFDDDTAFALRDETTGLTLGLPLTQDFDSMLPYDSFSITDPSVANPLSLSFSSASLARKTNKQIWATAITANVASQDAFQQPWTRVPLHIAPTCRLDTVLLEQTQSTRAHVQTSGPIPELTGQQPFPSIHSLLNPEESTTAPTQTANPISNAIGIHGRITMEIPTLPVKIAMMYNMCLYLRWMVSPTKSNYEALPEFLRPLEIQLTTPHPAWVDLIVWPQARERIIRFMDWTQFPALRAVGNKAISINWQHGRSKVFMSASTSTTALAEKEGLVLDPVFESHIRRLENWTFDAELSDTFPFLKDIEV